MGMYGFFVAVPEDKFEEFTAAEFPLELDYIQRWCVDDAWHVIQVVTRMNNFTAQSDHFDDASNLPAATGQYDLFSPERILAYHSYLCEMDALGKIERFRSEPVRIKNLYRVESIEGEELVNQILYLKKCLKSVLPSQNAETGAAENRYVVVYYVA